MKGMNDVCNRRRFLTLSATGLLAFAGQTTTGRAEANVPGEKFALRVCPSTPENPRHDHSQIFPLKDGRLLLAWSEYYVRRPSRITLGRYAKRPSGDADPCRISARVSEDRGRTWSEKITLQENIGFDNVKQSNLLRLPSGEVLFFFTVRDFRKKDDLRIYMRRSKNDCETWTEPVQISPSPGVYFLNADNVLLHSSGRIILPTFMSTTWSSKDHYRAFCFYSDDDGHTWKESRTRIDLPRRGAEEPTVEELRDRSLLVMLRTTLGKIYKALSHDRGETWSTPESTALNAPASPAFLRRNPTTGDLLLIWNNTLPFAMTTPRKDLDEYLETRYRNGPFHVPRNPLNCAISRDEGKTWVNVKEIENRKGYNNAYPSVTFVDDEALVTYYQHSRSAREKRELMLKIFDAEWFSKP